jgi:hypothetical protein
MELEHVRKILLMYRLLHYFDGLPNIKVSLKGREKELFYPLIRLFQNTGSTLLELKSVIDHFVNRRRENNEQTLHAQLYRSIIRLLVKEYTVSKEKSKLVDNRSNEKETKIKLEYLFSELWDHFIFDLDGGEITNRKRSADFGELGEVSQKEISKILIEVFGCKRKKTTAGNKAILLNPEKIIRLGTVYDVNTTLKVGDEVIQHQNDQQMFTDYLTNLTNLVKARAEKRQKEILEDLQNYA